MAANGIFMLSSPEIWFSVVPGVGRTGLFNQHFIRDIGILYIFIGGGFVYGALNPAYRLFLWTSATLWLTCHAIFHYLEVMTGICSPSYLITEFPAVTLPAVIGVIATLYALGSHRRNLAQHNK
ncbi:hypothetical protein DBY65_011875 [Pseudomonas sp. RIT412]|nr:hypothetical protein DBP26_003190 [Pseudomonas sp. RIT 409]RAU54349.1 hypothetical protein DBY65_011875 [Pseudomonas sp. RIT 412]